MKDKEMIFGLRAVIEAAQAGKDIDRVLVKRELQGELFRELQDVMALHEIPVQKVPLERINRFTRKNHQGVLAFISAVTYQKIEDIVPMLYEEGKNPFILDSKEPKGNFMDFIKGEIRYSQLENSFKEDAQKLYNAAEKNAAERYETYKRLAQS